MATGLALVLCLHSAVSTCAAAEPLLSDDFESKPGESGWRIGAGEGKVPDGRWTSGLGRSGKHALEVPRGWWESRALKCEPFEYYRVRFHSQVEGTGFWVVYFYDEQGKPLIANHREGIYPADDWREHTFCFRGRARAVSARIRFQAISAPLYIDDVVVEPVARKEVRDWADALAETLPKLNLDSGARAGPHLARTANKLSNKLRAGGRVRIVLLGDSIMNDTGNSAFEVLLERHYPKAQIELIHSIRGSTGCRYYRAENRVQTWVLDYDPDLVIIGGISHGFDADAVRDVVQQVRRRSAADVLVLSGAVCPSDLVQRNFLKYAKLSPEIAQRMFAAYRPALEALSREEKVEYFDIRAAWEAAVLPANRHPMWFHRDPIHANARGKQVLARILERYFQPDSEVKLGSYGN